MTGCWKAGYQRVCAAEPCLCRCCAGSALGAASRLASLDTRALATLAASALTSRPAAVAAIKCFKDLQGIEVAEENRVIAQFEVSV